MKKIFVIIGLVFINFLACGQNIKSVGDVHEILTNELTTLLSGYIVSIDTTRAGDISYLQSKIRMSESTDFDFVRTYVNLYLTKKTDLSLSIFDPWKDESTSSIRNYSLGLILGNINSDYDFIHLFYMEKDGNKDLIIFHAMK